jgi:PPM family protein phosphatase
MSIEICGGSDRGLIRENNEDSIGYSLYDHASIALAVVADGVAGSEGGEVASRIIVDSMKDYFKKSVLQAKSGGGYSEYWMEQNTSNAIQNANIEIINKQQQDKTISSMASTLVTLLVKGDRMTLANIGDSRCYLYRNKQLSQLTKDHTLADKMLEDGTITEEQYNASPYHHVLSRAMGTEKLVDADIAYSGPS